MSERALDREPGVLEQEDEFLDAQLYDADDLASLHTDEEPGFLLKPSRTRMKRRWKN